MENKNFYSLLDRPKTSPSCPGKKISKYIYIDKKGHIHKGEKNIDELIQDARDSVDYKKLIKECDKNGGNLNDFGISRNDKFADLSGYPDDLAGYIDTIKRMSNYFENTEKNNQKGPEQSSGKVEQQSQQVGVEGSQSNGKIEQEGGNN